MSLAIANMILFKALLKGFLSFCMPFLRDLYPFLNRLIKATTKPLGLPNNKRVPAEITALERAPSHLVFARMSWYTKRASLGNS